MSSSSLASKLQTSQSFALPSPSESSLNKSGLSSSSSKHPSLSSSLSPASQIPSGSLLISLSVSWPSLSGSNTPDEQSSQVSPSISEQIKLFSGYESFTSGTVSPSSSISPKLHIPSPS